MGILLILFCSCEKQDGKFYLRIIPPADTTLTDLVVLDANGEVPVDSQFHPVEKHAEIIYKLTHKLSTEIIDWTPAMPWDQKRYADFSFHEYMGEFKTGSRDLYYTITIVYSRKGGDEANYNQYGEYYYYYYSYSDQSTMTCSENP
ncbi:MAG: hypothetical protein ABIJ16_11765 [Bacteroidota bacterium]